MGKKVGKWNAMHPCLEAAEKNKLEWKSKIKQTSKQAEQQAAKKSILVMQLSSLCFYMSSLKQACILMT